MIGPIATYRSGASAGKPVAPDLEAWSQQHPAIVAQFVKDNPGTPQPKASDLVTATASSRSPDPFQKVVGRADERPFGAYLG